MMKLSGIMMMIGLALPLLGACGGSTTPSDVADASQLPADQVVFGVDHNMTLEGIRTGVLLSDTAYLYESGSRMDLMGVELRFFADNGLETGVLTSETGEYDTRSGAFVARGNVVLITQGPQGERRLETEELHYDVEADRLWSDVAFVLHEDGGTTTGKSFRSDSEFRNWTVTGAETQGGVRSGRSEMSF
jgi:LPS export ABC transporter protein LptC